MRALAIATICTGCAQVAGIQDTSKPAGQVSLELDRVYLGPTLASEPLVLATAPTVILPSSTVPAPASAPGTYTARASGALGVLYTGTDLPAPYQHVLSLGADQRASELVYVHQNAAAPDAAAAFTMNVTLPGTYAATQSLYVFAIGAWAAHQLTGAELPAVGASTVTASIPYAMFGPMTNESPLVKIVKADQVIVAKYVGQQLTGQLIIPPFDQTGSDMLMGTMAAVTPTVPFDAMIDPMTIAARLATVQPAGTSFAPGWRLDATPLYAVGQTGGIQLDGGAFVMTATTLSATFANPFAGLMWKPVLTYASSSTRTYTMGTMSLSLSSFLIEERDPGSGLTLDVTTALPQTATLGSTVLSTDGVTVTVDAAAPTDLTFTAESMPATLYGAAVYEIAPDMMGVLQRNRVLSLFALEPSFSIPAGVLQAGHTYQIDGLSMTGGYTGAPDGDMQTFSFPVSYAIAATGVFTVAGG